MKVFVDSNVPMYVGGRSHPNRERAKRFLERVTAGEFEACTSTEVLQEILYRYMGLRRPDLARGVYDQVVVICREIFPVTIADTDHAKEIVLGTAGVSVRDAIHAAVMANNGILRIATFDEGFDAVPGIRRLALD